MTAAPEGAATVVLIGEGRAKVSDARFEAIEHIGVDLGSGDDQTCQVVFLDGMAYSTAALIALADCHYVDRTPPDRAVPKYGNPRPYLKRKKGRS